MVLLTPRLNDSRCDMWWRNCGYSYQEGMAEYHYSPKSGGDYRYGVTVLTLLHSDRPKLYTILAFLSAIGLYNLVCSVAAIFTVMWFRATDIGLISGCKQPYSTART